MRYPQPNNEDEFEDFCLALLRDVWDKPYLARFGHRGERQFGVDLLDLAGVTTLCAIQCKHHRANKTIPPSEVRREVELAKEFPRSISEYHIFTTAKRSTAAQLEILDICKENAAAGQFLVHLHCWSDIEKLVDKSPAAKDRLGVLRGQGNDARKLSQLLDEGTRSLSAETPPSGRIAAQYEILQFDESIHKQQMNVLGKFCASDRGLSISILLGDGGVRKTRLAIELARRLRMQGWNAGFCIDQIPGELGRIEPDPKPTLMIYDDAEISVEHISHWLGWVRRLEATGSSLSHAVPKWRVLLLARSTENWLGHLYREQPWVDSNMDVASPISLQHLSRHRAQAVLDAWRSALGVRNIRPANQRSLAFRTPGEIAVLALDEGEAKATQKEGVAIWKFLLEQEKRFWHRCSKVVLGRPMGPLVEKHTLSIVALAALSISSLSVRDTEVILEEMLPHFSSGAFYDACSVAAYLYGVNEQGTLSRVPHKLLGELIVHQFFVELGRPKAKSVLKSVIETERVVGPDVLMLVVEVCSRWGEPAKVLQDVVVAMYCDVCADPVYELAMAQAIEAVGSTRLARKLRGKDPRPLPRILGAIARIFAHHLKDLPYTSRYEFAEAVLVYLMFAGEYAGRNEQDELLSAAIEALARESGDSIVAEPSLADVMEVNKHTRADRRLALRSSPLAVRMRNAPTLVNLMLRHVRLLTNAFEDRLDEAKGLLQRADRVMASSFGLQKDEISEFAENYYFSLGLVLMREERWREALSAFKMGLQCHVRTADNEPQRFAVNIGICQLMSGDTKAAKTTLRAFDGGRGGKALDDARVMHNIGVVLAHSGDAEGGFDYMMRALGAKGDWFQQHKTSDMAFRDFIRTADSALQVFEEIKERRRRALALRAVGACSSFKDLLDYPGLVFEVLAGEAHGRELVERVVALVASTSFQGCDQSLGLLAVLVYGYGRDIFNSGGSYPDVIWFYQAALASAELFRSDGGRVLLYLAIANDFANACWQVGRFEEGARCASEALVFACHSTDREVRSVRFLLLFNMCKCEWWGSGSMSAARCATTMLGFIDGFEFDDALRDMVTTFLSRIRTYDDFDVVEDAWLPVFRAVGLEVGE